MYQSPDFVKVDLDVKDNFAAYASCPANQYWVGGVVQNTTECENTGGGYQIMTDLYQTPENVHQCYSKEFAPI